MPEVDISVVIPTLGRVGVLRGFWTASSAKPRPPGSFEVIVVADAAERELAELDRVVAGCRYRPSYIRHSAGRIGSA